MVSPYLEASVFAAALAPITEIVSRRFIERKLYEHEYFCCDAYILKESYQNLSLSQKVIKGLARACFGALAIAFLNAGIAASMMKLFLNKVDPVQVQKFAIIGAIVGALWGILHEPGIQDYKNRKFGTVHSGVLYSKKEADNYIYTGALIL